jgi:hypothetical protein
MKLSKRLQYSYDFNNYKFYIFDPLLNLIYQYTSNGNYVTLEDVLSDYDENKISELNLKFISLDELITNIINNPEIMPLIGYCYEIWGRYSQDDLIVNCYKIIYKDKSYILQDKKYNKSDEYIDLEWPIELIERLDNIYKIVNIDDKFYL